jgi:hypothetical protein
MSSPMQMPPPPDGDVSRGSMVLGISWTMVALDITVVGLRFLVRFLKRSVGLDDYFMLVAMASDCRAIFFLLLISEPQCLFIATIAIVNMIVENGLGRHVYYIPPQNYEPFLKWVFILQSFTFFTLAFAKGSLVLLIVRLMGPEGIWRKRLLWAHMLFFFIITILSTIFDLVACKPLKAMWIPDLPGASCWPLAVNKNWAIAISGKLHGFVCWSKPLIKNSF